MKYTPYTPHHFYKDHRGFGCYRATDRGLPRAAASTAAGLPGPSLYRYRGGTGGPRGHTGMTIVY